MSSRWNKWSVVLGVAFGVCSSCGCGTPNLADERDQPARVTAEPDWRSSLETFQNHLSQVKKGWKAKQVFDYAGQPLEQGEGVLLGDESVNGSHRNVVGPAQQFDGHDARMGKPS